MKINIYRIYLLVLMLSLPMAGVQAQDNASLKTLIVGKWKLEIDQSLDAVSESRGKFENFSADQKEAINSNFAGQEIRYEADGQYVLRKNEADKLKGTWNIRNKKVKVLLDTEVELIFNIESIDESTLILQVNEEDSATALFEKLIYSKITNQ